MGILSLIILIILVIVFFLAILGLGWNTFFEGIKKGVDKLGITSIIENATGSSTEITKNTSEDIGSEFLGTYQISIAKQNFSLF